jgi:adenosylcobinamide-GDP ribazoletransferase
MVVSILLTGAFHEDGLADMCDGFGGGWTKEKILLIMKDSRIGTFGALGLIMVLGLKYFSLSYLPEFKIPILLLAGNTLSRWIAISFLYTHIYAREEGDSKTRPLASKMSTRDFLICSILGWAPLLLFWDYRILFTLPPLFMAWYYLKHLFQKWIGGYTGDCLGGVQQITEVVFYIVCGVIYHPMISHPVLPFLK